MQGANQGGSHGSREPPYPKRAAPGAALQEDEGGFQAARSCSLLLLFTDLHNIPGRGEASYGANFIIRLKFKVICVISVHLSRGDHRMYEVQLLTDNL